MGRKWGGVEEGETVWDEHLYIHTQGKRVRVWSLLDLWSRILNLSVVLANHLISSLYKAA